MPPKKRLRGPQIPPEHRQQIAFSDEPSTPPPPARGARRGGRGRGGGAGGTPRGGGRAARNRQAPPPEDSSSEDERVEDVDEDEVALVQGVVAKFAENLEDVEDLSDDDEFENSFEDPPRRQVQDDVEEDGEVEMDHDSFNYQLMPRGNRRHESKDSFERAQSAESEGGIEVLDQTEMDFTPQFDEKLIDVTQPGRVQIIGADKKSKRGDMSVIAKKIRFQVVQALRSVFQSRTNTTSDIISWSLKLINALKSAHLHRSARINMVGVFYNELEVRLCMMVEETSVPDHRARVFRLLAAAAVELNAKNAGREFMGFLLSFIDTWSMDTNVAARINAVSLVSYLFERGRTDGSKEPDTFCGFDAETSAKLYLYILKALLDKEATARVPGIRGMGVIQGVPILSTWSEIAREATPRELIIRSLRDISPVCRLTAVKTLDMKDKDSALFANIVYYDKSQVVRCAALLRFGKLKPQLRVDIKLPLLEHAFKDHDPSVRESAKQVLVDWVKYVSSTYVRDDRDKARDPDICEIDGGDENDVPLSSLEHFKPKGYYPAAGALVTLFLADTPETTEGHGMLRRVCRHLLDVVRQLYVCHAEPINTFADVINSDLRTEMFKESLPIINKMAFQSFMEPSDLQRTPDLASNRGMIMNWRCTIEFIVDNSRNEADKYAAVSRFMMTLKSTVEHIVNVAMPAIKREELVEERASEKDIEDTYLLSMSLLENLLPVFKHAPGDQSGKDAFKQFLISMLCNPFYQKKIYDLIIQELIPFYKDTPKELFALANSKAIELKQKYRGGEMAELEGTIHIGEQFVRNKWRMERETSRITEKEQGHRHLEFYELEVLNSLMKANILDEWPDEYQDKYITMLRRCFKSKDIDTRCLASECLGIIATYDLPIVEDEIQEMFKNFKTEEEPVQAVILAVLTDLFIADERALNRLTRPVNRQEDFSEVLANYIINTKEYDVISSEILFKVVESMARVLLNRKCDPDDPKWESNVTAMMFRAAWTIQEPIDSKIRSVIVVFLKFFCSMHVDHQIVLLKGYTRFFDLVTSAANIDRTTATVAKMKRCAASYVALTKHSALNERAREEIRPAHIQLIHDILVNVSNDNIFSDYYAYALPYIDWNDFERADQSKMHQEISEFITTFPIESSSRLTEMRRAEKKLQRILGLDSEDVTEDIDDVPSQASTTRTESRMSTQSKSTRGGGRRQMSQRAGALANIARGLDEQLARIQEEDDDEDDFEMGDPNQPSTSSRPPRTVAKRGGASTTATPSKAGASKKKDDVMELMSSPPKNAKKLPTRPTPGTRRAPTPTSNRTTPLRASRRLVKKDE